MTTSSLPPHLIEIENQLNALARTRMIYTLIFIAAIVILTVTGVTMAEARNAGSFSRGIDNFFDYPVDLFVEAFETGWAWWGLLLKHLPELMNTINLALFSTFLGFVFAVVLSLVASKNLIQNGFWVAVARRSLDIMRSFPELVIAMIFLYLMGKSELPALIAIWIHTVGALGKLFSEVVENCDSKPMEGLESAGANWWQKVRFGVFPQVMPLFLAYGMLRLEINVRASTILGFVGAGGIGAQLSTVIQWRYGDEILAIMALLVITITALDYLSSYVRNRLATGVV